MIANYLKQSITLERRSGSNDYGESTYAAGVTLSARVEQRTQLVRNSEGEQVVSQARVFLPAGSDCNPHDKITYSGQTYHVLAVDSAQALASASHIIAYLGG